MLLVFLSALAGLFIAVILFSETSFKLKAFEFSASLFPSLSGETVVVFPPLGKLRAATHLAPFLLEITLKMWTSISFPHRFRSYPLCRIYPFCRES